MADLYLRQVLDHAQRNQRVKESASGIFYQTATAAAGAGTGGLIGGPLGALVGTIVGAVYGYTNSNDYSSIFGIIQNLPNADKERLTETIRNHVGGMTFAQFIEWFKDLNHQAIFMNLLSAFVANQTSNTYRR